MLFRTFAFFLLLPASSLQAQSTTQTLVDDAAAGGFTGHVLGIRDGKVVVDDARGSGIDGKTVFSIGSITKRFTHAAILKLEEAGKLSTSHPVSRYIAGLPADKQQITLQQLIDMKSGLRDYHDDSGDHQRMNKAEALGRIGAQKLLFEPGKGEEYSNSGYTLLAAVIEAASGKTYEEYVRKELMAPAGMTSSGFFGDKKWSDARVARGSGAKKFGDNAPHNWPSVSWALMGAGGIVSNATDLARWVQAVNAGKILKPANVQKMYRGGRDWALYAGGDDFGFEAVVFELDRGTDIVVVNTNSAFKSGPLAAAVAQKMRDKPLPEEVTKALGGQQQAQNADDLAAKLVKSLQDGSDAVLREIVTSQFDAGMRDGFPMEEHLKVLGMLSKAARSAEDVKIEPMGLGIYEITFINSTRVTEMKIKLNGSGQIQGLQF